MCQRHRCSDVPECVRGEFAKPTQNSIAMSEILLQTRNASKAGNFAEAVRLYGEVCPQSSPIPGSLCVGFLRYQAAQYGEADG